MFAYFLFASISSLLTVGYFTFLTIRCIRENNLHRQNMKKMEQLLLKQKEYCTALETKIRKVQTLRHDLRHHSKLIEGFVKNGLHKELIAFISERREDIEETIEETRIEWSSPNHVINILATHYEQIARKNGIHFDLRCDITNDIEVPDTDLGSLLGNLLENATEACLRMKKGRRFIKIGIVQLRSEITIQVQNSTDESIHTSSRGFFLTSKKANHAGLGLHSARSIAQKYNGYLTVNWDPNNQVFNQTAALKT